MGILATISQVCADSFVGWRKSRTRCTYASFSADGAATPLPCVRGMPTAARALAVQVGGRNIAEVSALKISEVTPFLAGLADLDPAPRVRSSRTRW